MTFGDLDDLRNVIHFISSPTHTNESGALCKSLASAINSVGSDEVSQKKLLQMLREAVEKINEEFNAVAVSSELAATSPLPNLPSDERTRQSATLSLEDTEEQQESIKDHISDQLVPANSPSVRRGVPPRQFRNSRVHPLPTDISLTSKRFSIRKASKNREKSVVLASRRKASLQLMIQSIKHDNHIIREGDIYVCL
jgi:hypothetical protein